MLIDNNIASECMACLERCYMQKLYGIHHHNCSDVNGFCVKMVDLVSLETCIDGNVDVTILF